MALKRPNREPINLVNLTFAVCTWTKPAFAKGDLQAKESGSRSLTGGNKKKFSTRLVEVHVMFSFTKYSSEGNKMPRTSNSSKRDDM